MENEATAKRGRETKGRQVPPDLGAWFRHLYQRGIIGLLSTALALVVFLSLFQETRGLVVNWLSGVLLQLFGWGSYLVVLLLAVGGILLMLNKVPDRKRVPWHIVIGSEVAFLALSGLTHLYVARGDPWVAARAGYGGGYVGAVFSAIPSDLLGPWGALLILGTLLTCGLVIASGLSVEEWLVRLEDGFWRARDRLVALLTELFSRLPPPQDEPSAPAQPVQAETAPATQTTRSRRPGTGLPSLKLLDETPPPSLDADDIRQKARTIEETLAHFDVPAAIVETNWGPRVTQFGVEPGYVTRRAQSGEETERKVRVAKIASLSKDLSLALAAAPVRVEAPVPGRSIVGIEVPNDQVAVVSLRKGMSSTKFRRRKSALTLVLGEGVAGTPLMADLAKMPHLLIAGATGSGKSVCINAIVTCLLFQNSPLTLRMVMIDPKRVEMVRYAQLPHLYGHVESEAERVVVVLDWLVQEMQERYEKLSRAGVRHVQDYNRLWHVGSSEYLPRIVVLIDELADLMLFAPDRVERSICRLAQMARATGMHLVLATQRPSVDVVTGLIKANFPARIGFAVTSGVDSRVILDAVGAETLLSKGDLLYMPPDSSKLVRAQGCFVSEAESERIVAYWQQWASDQGWEREPMPWESLLEGQGNAEGDELLQQAIQIVREQGQASASMLQRRLPIGYPRAARLIDELEERGVVGPAQSGGRARKVLDLEVKASLSQGGEK